MHTDRIRKIPHTTICMQVKRRNVMPEVQVIIATFFYTEIKIFSKLMFEGQVVVERTNMLAFC